MSGGAGAWMAAFDFGNRFGNERLEDLQVKVRQALEVKAGLAHLVRPEPGQALDLPGTLRNEVHDQLPAADCEADEACVARVAALVPVGVRAVADDARPPHSRRLLRHPLADGHDGLAVRQLPRAGPGREVRIDACGGWLGLGLGHRSFLRSRVRGAGGGYDARRLSQPDRGRGHGGHGPG